MVNRTLCFRSMSSDCESLQTWFPGLERTLASGQGYLHKPKLKKMTSTDFGQQIPDASWKDKFDLKTTFQRQNERYICSYVLHVSLMLASCPPPVHRPSTARPPLVHRPSTTRPPPVHRPSTARPPPVHRPSTARPPPVHRPSTAPPLPVHRPSTARPPPVHRPSTARPPPVHRPSTARPPPVHRPSTARPPPSPSPYRCRGTTTWVRPTCVVRPNVVASKYLEPNTERHKSCVDDWQHTWCRKITDRKKQIRCRKSYFEDQLICQPRSKQQDSKAKDKTRQETNSVAAGFTAWVVAFPVMVLLVAIRTPAVGEEDLYDDPLVPWKYGRKPTPHVVG
ncbi:hypothetical protein LSAT2_016032 [Lamellibrachia satsuma]|nr:hypothetical protein LSAT2_016032 [Lamellibrachia satsuma]